MLACILFTYYYDTDFADSFRSNNLSFLTVSTSSCVLDVPVKMLQNLAGEIFFVNVLSLVNLLLVTSGGTTGGAWLRGNVRYAPEEEEAPRE